MRNYALTFVYIYVPTYLLIYKVYTYKYIQFYAVAFSRVVDIGMKKHVKIR